MSRTYRPNGERERSRRMGQGAYFAQLLGGLGQGLLDTNRMGTDGWRYHANADAWVHPTGVTIQHEDLRGGQYARAHATHQV